MTILYSDKLKPTYFEETYDQNGGSVNVKVYTGIGESVSADAGWYISCNGRMIIGADKTLVTGWGMSGPEPIPKYHNRFSRFRGVVYFTSENGRYLPWNTTKSGVDASSAIYRVVKQKMVTLMRPVLTLLCELDEERDLEIDDKPLEVVVTKSQLRGIKMTKIYRLSLKHPNFPISDSNYYDHVVIANSVKEAREMCPKDEPAWLDSRKSVCKKIGVSTLKSRVLLSG